MSEERLTIDSAAWRDTGYSHLRRYEFALSRCTGRVLDVACGIGYGSYILGQRGDVVVGVDISSEAINIARVRHARANVAFHLGPLESLPTETPLFDCAVCFETIEHVPSPSVFLAALAARLKPGAPLLISAPNALTHTKAVPPVANPYHLSEPAFSELIAWLAPDFVVREEWEQAPLLPKDFFYLSSQAAMHAAHESLWIGRALRSAERTLRRLIGRPVPPPHAVITPPGALVHDMALIPLLPQRRLTADTFVVVANRR